MPHGVAASLTEEVALLSAGARRVLEGASVAGATFEPELAAAAAAVDEASATRALDELLAAGLIAATDVPRRFRLRHPLLRRAVYEAAPGGWRLGAHERCARALAERGASPPARAHHVEHAARHGDPAALALLADAAAGVAPRAPAIAARWYGAALRLLPDGAPSEQRVGLLMARAQTLAGTGKLDEGRADLVESMALLPAEAVEPRTMLTAACARIEHLLGEHRQAQARLAAALDALPDPAAPEAATLMIQLALDALFRADHREMRDWAARALDGARPLADRPLTAAAAGVLALAEACTGATAAAEAHRAEALAVVDALPDAELATFLEAAGWLATAELYLDRYEAAIAHARRGLEIGRATGRMAPSLVPTLVVAAAMRGRLDGAAQALDGALESARLSGIDQALAWTLVHRSTAAMAAGDLERALSAAEEAIELAPRTGERFISTWCGVALATALLPAGDPARAVEVLLRWTGGEELPTIPGGWRAMGHELHARCLVALGRPDEARAAAARAEATAAATGLPMATAWAHRAAAAVALEAEPALAAARALQAADAAEGADAAIEAALSRALAGQALARAGERERAVAALEQAAAALDACGAQRHRDAVERELRKLGRQVHRRSRAGEGDGVASLTARELQLARLVVERKTNPEIAAEPFLSLKTVETHLRNIFRKVDVASRVELARAVERADRAR